MSPAFPLLRFAWWNVQDFAHFDPNRVSEERWPTSQTEYEAKCLRVDAALRDLDSRHAPDVLGLCEITQQVAEGLRQRLFPTFRLVFPPSPSQPFQVAVLLRPKAGFRDNLPLYAPRVPRATRGMPVVNHVRAGHHIRFVFCHWPAFGEQAEVSRDRVAERVMEEVYSFLREPGTAKSVRHVVVLGDLNEEPFGNLFGDRLIGTRDRARATRPHHWADSDVRRVHLYNPTWRLLGERYPHAVPVAGGHHAGTYFNENDREWRTYDQLLVSGSLLTDSPPFLDEGAFGIMVLPGCLGTAGYPEKFDWNNGQPTGLSDHLPLVGRIALPTG